LRRVTREARVEKRRMALRRHRAGHEGPCV
jgi:hypothetical protein